MIYIIRYPQDEGVKYDQFRYPGGEVQVRLRAEELERLESADKIHVVATIKDGEIMALAQLTDAIAACHTEKTLILPYLPYSRADRRFVEGDCFGLAVFSDLVNALDYDAVVTLDAHSEVPEDLIIGFKNVSPVPLIEVALTEIGGKVAIVLPDEGASRYGIHDVLKCTKHRDPETGKLSGFSVPPKEAFEGYNSILIVDDICDGGGTFIGIADQLKHYELDMYLYVTHGIFSKGTAELYKYFERIYTTDSLEPEASKRVIVIPCEGVIRDAILERGELYELYLEAI